MNIIKRILIENIKGKDIMNLTFNDMHANQPNILVAPNGFGKSTIAVAFEASRAGRMKLSDKDVYQHDPNNHPKLEVEIMGENAGTYTATDESSTISQNISVYVINNPIYAKSTSRNIRSYMASSAELSVEQVILYDSIPDRVQINYSNSAIKQEIGREKGKLFLNIKDILQNSENLNKLYELKDSLDKCIKQVRIQTSFQVFLDSCGTVGSATMIKQNINQSDIDAVLSNNNVKVVVECISHMNLLPEGWLEVDSIFAAIQICKTIATHYNTNERDILKKASAYLEYKVNRAKIDERLASFNTTGRTVRTKQQGEKLVVDFERANSMSNGERDVLSFVTNLAAFEQHFKKDIGILVIDEVFDYLDGCNMLAVQYYLSQTIQDCKNNGKILFPLIFTHLDPEVFGNYYLKKKKVHYLSCLGEIDLDSDIVKIIRLRENYSIADEEKKCIAKYYLHYHPNQNNMNETLKSRISNTFPGDSTIFRTELYNEVTNKYLQNKSYNPVMVIAALRIKIEEKLYAQLQNETEQNEFLNTHKTLNKLNYVEEKGIDSSELFYLLQPLYNDGLHLSGSDNAVLGRIKSTYLKLDNLHIVKMIEEVFS